MVTVDPQKKYTSFEGFRGNTGVYKTAKKTHCHNNNDNNNNKNNTRHISTITGPILTKLLMKGFCNKTTTKTTIPSLSSTTSTKTTTATNISQLNQF